MVGPGAVVPSAPIEAGADSAVTDDAAATETGAELDRAGALVRACVADEDDRAAGAFATTAVVGAGAGAVVFVGGPTVIKPSAYAKTSVQVAGTRPFMHAANRS
jgi:hypothetical protein